MSKSLLLVFVAASLVACAGPSGTPHVDPDPVEPCRAENLAGEPVVDLQWELPRETYIAVDDATTGIAINYIVDPLARVDEVRIEPNFDPLTPTTITRVTQVCPLDFPRAALSAGVPPGTEDVVGAVVYASPASGIGTRTGRVFATTGTAHVTLRTDGLDAGDPANGDWWLLYEPAPGNGRVMLAPARLDRTTFEVSGIPTGQAGIIALVQTQAIDIDPSTRAMYAPWGFGDDWRRFVRAWYANFIVAASADTLVPVEVVPAAEATTTRYPFASMVALSAGATRELRGVEADIDTTIAVDCAVTSVGVTVVTYSEIVTGPVDSPTTTGPGEHVALTGGCASGDASWPLPLRANAANGRNVMLMLTREAP